MNVLERKKLKFRSFTVSEFHSFFVRCRRTYILNKFTKPNLSRKIHFFIFFILQKYAYTEQFVFIGNRIKFIYIHGMLLIVA